MTELLEGETLRARIAGGALPVRKVVDYAAQIADGLAAAHEHRIVHREMASGRRAFRGESAAETLHAILKEDPPSLLETGRGLPPALERIVGHCLE